MSKIIQVIEHLFLKKVPPKYYPLIKKYYPSCEWKIHFIFDMLLEESVFQNCLMKIIGKVIYRNN